MVSEQGLKPLPLQKKILFLNPPLPLQIFFLLLQFKAPFFESLNNLETAKSNQTKRNHPFTKSRTQIHHQTQKHTHYQTKFYHSFSPLQ